MPKKGNSFQSSDKSLEGEFLDPTKQSPEAELKVDLDVERPGTWRVPSCPGVP